MLVSTKLQNYTKAQKYKKIQFLFAITLLIFVDQISKYIVRSFGGFYICNSGIAFGIKIPFIIFWLFLIIIFIIFNLKFKISNYPAIFILSGAVSNIVDRLHLGCVIDFIDLKFWPLFNFADIFICAGIFMLILKNVKCKYQNGK